MTISLAALFILAMLCIAGLIFAHKFLDLAERGRVLIRQIVIDAIELETQAKHAAISTDEARSRQEFIADVAEIKVAKFGRKQK